MEKRNSKNVLIYLGIIALIDFSYSAYLKFTYSSQGIAPIPFNDYLISFIEQGELQTSLMGIIFSTLIGLAPFFISLIFILYESSFKALKEQLIDAFTMRNEHGQLYAILIFPTILFLPNLFAILIQGKYTFIHNPISMVILFLYDFVYYSLLYIGLIMYAFPRLLKLFSFNSSIFIITFVSNIALLPDILNVGIGGLFNPVWVWFGDWVFFVLWLVLSSGYVRIFVWLCHNSGGTVGVGLLSGVTSVLWLVGKTPDSWLWLISEIMPAIIGYIILKDEIKKMQSNSKQIID